MNNTQWAGSIDGAFEYTIAQILASLPNILFAILVVIVGFIIANIIKQLLVSLFNRLHVDKALDSAG